MADDEQKGSLVNIDLGDLGGAAKSLVERVAAGCGVLYEPHRIVKKAKAEAEADKVKALSKLEIGDIERRALQRFLHEETKKQENIEAITEKALEFLPKDAKPEKIEEDWMTRFLDKGKQVSDRQMQEIWAKVLAGEASAAGKYSKRTLELLHSLSKKDADHLVSLYRFAWKQLAGATPIPGKENVTLIFRPMIIIFNLEGSIYQEHGINFTTLQHLETIGVIKFENLSDFQLQNSPIMPFCYPGSMPLLVKPQQGQPIPLGKVMLTESGTELYEVCGTTPTKGVWEYTKQQWQNKGLEAQVSQVDYFAPAQKASA